MKNLLLAASMFVVIAAGAQIPAPQIGLTGNIGCQGFPCVNNGTLIFTSDADHAMTARETSAFYIKVTSSVSLTATRNLVAPLGNFPFTIENATTGGQSIQIIGPSGTGITISNGSTISTWNDGTNYVQSGLTGDYLRLTGGTLTGPLTDTSGFVGPLTGNVIGTASNITATTNSTLTTLSALSLPYGQVSGTPSASTWASVTGGTQTGSGTSQMNTFPGNVTANNLIGDGAAITHLSGFPTRTTWTIPTSGWSAQEAYGYSITCGIAATNAVACNNQGYVNQLNTYIGAPTLHNYAVSGTSDCTIALSAFTYGAPASGDNIFRSIEFGMNQKGNSPSNLFQPSSCRKAAITWLGSPSGTKYTATSFGTLPTNWSADTTTIPGITVLSTTTSTAPAVFNCTGVANNSVSAPYGYCFLWYFSLDTNSYGITSGIGASFTYKLDSDITIGVSLSTAPTSGSIAPGGTVAGAPGVVAIPMTTAGTHTLTITPYLNSGDTAIIIGAGTNSGSTTADPLWVVGVTYGFNDNNEPSLAQIYDQQKQETYQAQQWGLNAYFVPTRDCMLGTTDEMWSGDTTSWVHPNLLGHTHITNCFISPTRTYPVTGAIPDPTLYGSYKDLTGAGPFNLSPGDQIVIIDSTSNPAQVYLPTLSSPMMNLKTIIIFNTGSNPIYVGGNFSTIAVIVPAQNSAEFYSTGTGSWSIKNIYPGYGELNLSGCTTVFTSTFTLSDAVPCYLFDSSSAIVATVPTSRAGDSWFLLNAGAGAVTFSGITSGTAKTTSMGTGDGGVLTVPYATWGYWAGYYTENLSLTNLTVANAPIFTALRTAGYVTNTSAGVLGTTPGIPYTALTGTVPTWNQSTTGNAATATYATSAGTAPAGTLTGTTLASNVVSSSLTSVGTLSSLDMSGNINMGLATSANALYWGLLPAGSKIYDSRDLHIYTDDHTWFDSEGTGTGATWYWTAGATPTASGTTIMSLDGNGNLATSGTFSATTPTFTSLTGYVSCNGTSPCTAATSIPNSSLENSSVTINGIGCTLGSSCAMTFEQFTNASWSIQPTVFSTATMLGPVYFATYGSAYVPKIVVRSSGTISCTVAPTVNLMNLGIDPANTYSGATSIGSVATSTSDGVFSANATVSILSGNYYGIAFSAGTCVTAPTIDVTVNAVW